MVEIGFGWKLTLKKSRTEKQIEEHQKKMLEVLNKTRALKRLPPLASLEGQPQKKRFHWPWSKDRHLQ